MCSPGSVQNDEEWDQFLSSFFASRNIEKRPRNEAKAHEPVAEVEGFTTSSTSEDAEEDDEVTPAVRRRSKRSRAIVESDDTVDASSCNDVYKIQSLTVDWDLSSREEDDVFEKELQYYVLSVANQFCKFLFKGNYLQCPSVSFRVHVVRRCAHGSEFQAAYMDLVAKSKHFPYIENQFFVSGMDGNGIVRNRILQALVDRIERAVQRNERFRVYVVISLLPAFEATFVATSSRIFTQ
ncbi:hypothetical protein PsorP6_005075 [Peronosclerospora sorghi]|uniref:Uncharacterized protein n=1 Tax=Peronosclerospora sorghi TaxID=230839 RepID=A0ACC0W556_9STRA|nr:hypothetical protein PsorP6_005075 [Peronosclerospora sorghi]